MPWSLGDSTPAMTIELVEKEGIVPPGGVPGVVEFELIAHAGFDGAGPYLVWLVWQEQAVVHANVRVDDTSSVPHFKCSVDLTGWDLGTDGLEFLVAAGTADRQSGAYTDDSLFVAPTEAALARLKGASGDDDA